MSNKGIDIKLPNLQAPEIKFSSPIDLFQKSLAHEKKVTKHIRDLYKLTQSLEEYDTGAFVLWFLGEQVEEEDLFAGVISKLLMYKDSPDLTTLFMDKELGKRQLPGSSSCCGK